MAPGARGRSSAVNLPVAGALAALSYLTTTYLRYLKYTTKDGLLHTTPCVLGGIPVTVSRNIHQGRVVLFWHGLSKIAMLT